MNVQGRGGGGGVDKGDILPDYTCASKMYS